MPTDDEILARVMRRILTDTEQNAFVQVNPEDYPESGVIDGNVTLEPGESEVLDRIYRQRHFKPGSTFTLYGE
jgi:hypothetical protein